MISARSTSTQTLKSWRWLSSIYASPTPTWTPTVANWLEEYQFQADRLTFVSPYLPVLFGSVARFPGAAVGEIGVNGGESTRALLAAAELVGGHVWSVDIDPNVKFLEMYDGGPWTLIVGDSSALSIADQVPSALDVLYVDGDHSYKGACADIREYLPRVRPGGMALFHDVSSNPYVPEFQVREALDDLLPSMGLKWQEMPGTCGLGIVRVPVAHPCWSCNAAEQQVTFAPNPASDKQMSFTGGAPIQVCRGCYRDATAL